MSPNETLFSSYKRLETFANGQVNYLSPEANQALQEHLAELRSTIQKVTTPALGNFAGLTDCLMVIDNLVVPEIKDDGGNLLFSKEELSITQEDGLVVAKFSKNGVHLDLAVDPKVIKPLISPEGAPLNGVGYGPEQNEPSEHH